MVGSGTCLHPAGAGGSQFTMTLCTGLSQTTKNDNGYRTHSRFSGFVTIPCMGSWWTGNPPALQDGGRCQTMMDPTMTEHGICPGASICYIYSGIKLGEEWLFKSWFCQYISLPTKYTISGSILQYNMGLTKSFSSLISRGVGPFQFGNTYIWS